MLFYPSLLLSLCFSASAAVLTPRQTANNNDADFLLLPQSQQSPPASSLLVPSKNTSLTFNLNTAIDTPNVNVNYTFLVNDTSSSKPHGVCFLKASKAFNHSAADAVANSSDPGGVPVLAQGVTNPAPAPVGKWQQCSPGTYQYQITAWNNATGCLGIRFMHTVNLGKSSLAVHDPATGTNSTLNGTIIKEALSTFLPDHQFPRFVYNVTPPTTVGKAPAGWVGDALA